MPHSEKDGSLGPDLMATLRASVDPSLLESASPEQTLQQRPVRSPLAAGQNSMSGLSPTIVMPGRPVETQMIGEMVTLKKGSEHSSESELAFTYGNESLARWSEFTIHSLVGKGGMGQIFLAGQNALRREVAIKKIIPERLTGSDATETEASFVSEALVTGFLAHPNIVPIYALGRDDSGKWFFSMKMVRGIEWRHLMHPDRCKDAACQKLARARNHSVDDPSSRAEHLEDNLRILFSVCNAVAFAHSKKIVHRDLKPENVMVGEFGEVLVMDWGLAVDVSDTPAPPGSLERRVWHRSDCCMGGTPAYMSPEQFEFDAAGHYKGDRLDRWTDVFLLGGMLYEILTGHPPYVAPSLNTVFEKIVECNPPALPESVPPELAAICRKALAKDPRERFEDALAFQRALQDFLKHREAALIAAKAEKEATVQAIPNLARSAVLYAQALELWPDNARYKEAESVVREALKKLEARARFTRYGLFAAVAGIVLGLSIGFVWIRSEEKKTEAALKQQTLLSFEMMVENASMDDDYERVIRELDPYLGISDMTMASGKFLKASQLRENAATFAAKNRGAAERVRNGAKSVELYLAHNTTLELLRIPAGEFKMGSPENEAGRAKDESPQHTVSISSFYLGKFDVTQEQYEAVIGVNPSAYRGPKNPVDSVSWVEASEFCRKLNRRLGSSGVKLELPTEAQWEYACRAGSATRFYFGNNEDDLKKYAWYKANSHDTEDNFGTNPVGLKPPNAFGLYDMHGNVFQWCQDWYDSAYYSKSPARDPEGPSKGEYMKQIKGPGRVLRGGSWDFDANECRSANRDANQENYRSFRRGFRVAMRIPAKP